MNILTRHLGAVGVPTVLVVGAALLAAPSSPSGAPALELMSSSARWSTPVEISNPATRDARDLVIDANAAGDLAAAWVLDDADDIAAVLKKGTAAPGAPQVFVGTYDDPDVAIGGQGVGVLAFETGGSDDTTVYAASKTAGATSFGTSLAAFHGDGHVAPVAAPSAQDPTVAVNDQGVGMLFFERDYFTPPSYNTLAEAIEGRVLQNPSTNSWNAGTTLHPNPRDPRNTEVSVAADGSVFLAASLFENGPYWYIGSMVLNPDGSGDYGDTLAGAMGGPLAGIKPSNARLPDGSVLLSYHNNSSKHINLIEFSKARAMGDGAAPPTVRLDNEDGSERGTWPIVRTDAAGNAVVVWHDSTGTQSILARYRAAGSASWGPVEVISSGGTYQGSFDLDTDAAGNVFLVYRQSGPNALLAVERTPGAGGTWTAPEQISGDQQMAEGPFVAAGKDGHAYAAWIGRLEDRVYLASLTPKAPVKPGPGKADTKAPKLRLKAAKKQSNKKRIRVTARCDERCTVNFATKGKAAVKKRPAGTPKKFKLKLKAVRPTLTANKNRKINLKFKGAKTKRIVRKVLRSKQGRIKLVLRGTATDAAGNRSRQTVRITLR